MFYLFVWNYIYLYKFFQADRSVGKRPVLVELYSFPGYDKVTCTPLPYPLKARSILSIVLNAQCVLKKKVICCFHYIFELH